MNKTLIASIIGTKGGWLSRQLLKFITIGSSSVTAWLLAKDVPEETVTLMVAGIVAGASWLAELGLSKLASKIAVPCLACCLILSSCSTDPLTGQKTFAGISSASFQQEAKEIALQIAEAGGKAAAQAALNVAEAKLAEMQAKPVDLAANPMVLIMRKQALEQAQKLVDTARLKVASFRFKSAKHVIDVQP